MKIAILDVCWKHINSKNPLNEAHGGSETWLIQIANEFAKHAQVDVYCDCENYKHNDNLEYINFNNFTKLNKKYDFVILNRFFFKNGINYITYIKTHHQANHIYVQIHDLSFISENKLLPAGYNIDKFGLNYDFVTIVTLNEWHKNNLISQYNSLIKKPIYIPNGVDLSLFPTMENKQRDNRILWSSSKHRGLDILINDIYPIVKKDIPDFGIDIASYENNIDEYNIDNKDINILGQLTKTQLYDEMQKHKVWFYPCTFAETFCITAIEAIMNGQEIVSPCHHGLSSTLEYTNEIAMKSHFSSISEVYNKAVKEAAKKIINILKKDNVDDKPLVYERIKDKIVNEYNWSYSVNKYLTHYKSISYDENNEEKITEINMNHNKNILILSMSCNNSYFKSLLAVVKDTWAKPIIQGKYKNVQWFAYTACDKNHPYPYIDFEDHIIYVDCADGLFDTYEKTQKAYRMLLNAGINDFNYVVRTNTSVFVNIDKMIDKINSANENEILGGEVGYYHVYPDGKRVFKWNIVVGLFFGMFKDKFDIAMSATNNYDVIPASDDVIISGKLNEVYGDSIKVISPNNCKTIFPRYKPYKTEDVNEKTILDALSNGDITVITDAKEINNNVIIQVRPLYGELKERSEKGHEFEHFYELYNALEIGY